MEYKIAELYTRKSVELNIETHKDTTIILSYKTLVDTYRQEITTTNKKMNVVLLPKVRDLVIETSNNNLVKTITISNTSNGNLFYEVNSNKFEIKDEIRGEKFFNFEMFNLKEMLPCFIISFLCFLLINTNWFYNKKISTSSTKFNDNVEFLRFVFTIFIILGHEGIGMGWIMVDFFFLMSGYYLYNSVQNSNLTLKDFVIKRLLRLYPVLFLSMLLCRSDFFSTFLASFMLNVVVKTDLMYFFGWYVYALFWCSIIIFSTYKIFDTRKVDYLFAILCYMFYTYLLNIGLHKHYGFSIPFVSDAIIRGMAGLLLGIFLHKFIKYFSTINIKIDNYYLISFCEIFLFLKIMYLMINVNGKNSDFNSAMVLYMLLSFCILFTFFIFKKGILSNLLDNKISQKLGMYSYATYLLQGRSVRWYDSLTDTIGIPNYLLGKVIFCVIVGAIVYYIVERPSFNYLYKRIYDKLIRD